MDKFLRYKFYGFQSSFWGTFSGLTNNRKLKNLIFTGCDDRHRIGVALLTLHCLESDIPLKSVIVNGGESWRSKQTHEYIDMLNGVLQLYMTMFREYHRSTCNLNSIPPQEVLFFFFFFFPSPLIVKSM